MSDVEFCLEAYVADPSDNLARLAYADALEESGQLRMAELIRDGRYPTYHPHWAEWNEKAFLWTWWDGVYDGYSDGVSKHWKNLKGGWQARQGWKFKGYKTPQDALNALAEACRDRR